MCYACVYVCVVRSARSRATDELPQLSREQLREAIRARAQGAEVDLKYSRGQPPQQPWPELATLRRVWRKLDPSLSGHVSIEAFASLMRKGATSKRASGSSKAAPADGSGGSSSSRNAAPADAVRSRVSADETSRRDQRVCARQLQADRSHLSAEAARLQDELRQMRKEVIDYDRTAPSRVPSLDAHHPCSTMSGRTRYACTSSSASACDSVRAS
jgi:hypothetical protein